MDNQEYLRQISQPLPRGNVPQSGSGFDFRKIVSSLYFKLGVGTVIALILISILGSILGGIFGGDGLKNNCLSLKIHIDNVTTTINNYQRLVKSSDLRSSSASLTSILTSTNRTLADFLAASYGIKDNETKSLSANLLEEEQTEFDAREQLLFNAKINGTLDRHYAHQIAYEISYIISKENTIIKYVRDDTTKTALTSSVSSLENLYPKFNDFSETRN